MNGDDQKQPAPSQAGDQWQYKPEESTPVKANPPQPTADYTMPSPEVAWTASEFVAHNKGMEWFGMLALVTVVLVGLVYLLTKDITSVIIIVLVAIIFGIAAVRKPRVLTYTINSNGLTIGQKYYAYAEFKSFSVMQEGAFSSITFLPLKRFMPPISIYYEPKDEDRIIEVLAQFLPMENRQHDIMDRFVNRIRF